MIVYIINLALCLFGTFVFFYFLIVRFAHWSFKIKWKAHVSNGYWFKNVFRWGILSLNLKGKKITIGNVKFVKPEKDQLDEIENLTITLMKKKECGVNNLLIVGTNIYIDLIFFQQSNSMKGTMVYNDKTHYVSFPMIDDIEKYVKIQNTPAETIRIDQTTLLKKQEEDEEVKYMGDTEVEGKQKK